MIDHEPLLSVKDVSFRYPAATGTGGLVLDGVGFRVTAGSTTVLMGRADAGKTTLARVIAGLVPRFTGGGISGEIRLRGRGIRSVPPYDLVESVGLVAQDSEEQLFTTRCDTEVAFALESLGLPRHQIGSRVSESLEKVGLSGFDHRNPATLSGGEKKRLLVACLLAVRPDLWILDEALSELDFDWKARVLEIVSATAGAVLLMESRWSTLIERRGSAFSLLGRGRVLAAASSSTDERLAAALRSAGIRLSLHSAPVTAAPTGSLQVRGVRFRFPGGAGFALDVDRLEIGFGEVCALVGRNGSGKSTLARILCGLLPPQEGSIAFQGVGGGRPALARELNARIGYLFQNPDHQIFLPTVREELGLGLRGLHLSRAETDARVSEAARCFDLPDLDFPPALLSYGARRRLQAATYFLLSRDLLILDEVDSGLSYGEIEDLVDRLASRVPGLVLITHDLALARSACHRVLVMERGMIIRDVTASSLGPGSGAGIWEADL